MQQPLSNKWVDNVAKAYQELFSSKISKKRLLIFNLLIKYLYWTHFNWSFRFTIQMGKKLIRKPLDLLGKDHSSYTKNSGKSTWKLMEKLSFVNFLKKLPGLLTWVSQPNHESPKELRILLTGLENCRSQLCTENIKKSISAKVLVICFFQVQ